MEEYRCNQLLLSVVFVEIMWKAKKRTGGIRRKIAKEYTQIINYGKKTTNEQLLATFLNIPNKSSVSQYVSHEGSVFTNTTNNDNGEQSINVDCTTSEDEDSICERSSSTDSDELCEKVEVFRQNLKKWAIDKSITQTALKDLAVIINEYVSDSLPIDPRTILKTPRIIDIKKIEGGEYWHNGYTSLKQILANWQDAPQEISLNINFDGLPIFKSSKHEFWPILCSIHENNMYRPFVIGIYFGVGKPKNLDTYLQDFINDTKTLLTEGFYVQERGRTYKIKIRCFICDSPARAYIKGMAKSPKC